jgi:tetratricopeptide (TPR) repeat protein
VTVRSTVGCAAVVLILAATPAGAQRQTPDSLDAIDKWVKMVDAHVPGRPDASLGAVVAMRYDTRRNLNTAVPLFIRVLREREVVVTRSGFDQAVTRLARSVRLQIGSATFLKRAAVLHADAVVFANRFPRGPDDAPRLPVGAGRSPQRVAPLLSNRRVVLTRDGEIIADAPANWNLPFARSLLDELLRPVDHIVPAAECAADPACWIADLPSGLADRPRVLVPVRPVSAADRAFVGEWYHALAAYLFAAGMNGDATSHLDDAARVRPDDARLLFDRGSYAETLGLRIYQAVQDAAGARPNAFTARIPSEEQTNAEAERLYRRALEIDPTYLEARVRYARLLERRGQPDQAAAEIGRVLEARPSGVVGYYAFLVAGRVSAARRRYGEALRHYQAALELYPAAQSASLGASHAALMLADVADTLAPLQQLGHDEATFDSDPWLDYQLGAGRDVNELMARLWALASR